MKVGLMINTQFPPETDARAQVANMIEQVRTARQSGFASLWFPHHYLTAPMQMFQLTAVLPYLMREAEGMLVGGDIMVLPLLNPVSVAEDAVTLDVLSGGNFVLGVGLGYREPEYEAFGIPLSERMPRFVESLELIRRLWTEQRVTFAGRFYTVTDAGVGLRPIRPAGPPVWIGGQVEAAIRRAAQIGDAWHAVPTMTPDALAAAMKVFKQARQEAGKPEPEHYPLTRECYVGTSQATAMQECIEPLRYKYNTYASWGQHAQKNKPAVDIAEFARDRFIIGDKDSVRDEIGRYRELGFNHFIMRCGWPGLPQARVLNSIRSLGEIFA